MPVEVWVLHVSSQCVFEVVTKGSVMGSGSRLGIIIVFCFITIQVTKHHNVVIRHVEYAYLRVHLLNTI